MKRFFLILAAATALYGNAESITRLNVWTTDGNRMVYAMAEAPRVSFEDQDLVVTMGENTTSTPMDKVVRFTYDVVDASDVTGIDRIDSAKGAMSFALRPGVNTVEVYNLKGELVSSRSVIAEEDTVGSQIPLSLDGLAPDYYVVKVNDVSYKLLKR